MLPSPGFCKHAIWIFGVLVGLAIKEAVTRVGPHLLTLEANATRSMTPEFWRLIVFGLMIIRFYLGAAHLFDDIHAGSLVQREQSDGTLSVEERARLRTARRQFAVDFFSGLLHFTLFSVWSLTLEIHSLVPGNAEPIPNENAFRYILLILLLYDVGWVIARGRPHPKKVPFWMVVNVALAITSSALYYLLHHRFGWTSLDAEVPPLILVAAVSFLDGVELVRGAEVFSTAIRAILSLVGGAMRNAGERIAKLGRE
jgi:hypothetical protein